MSGVPRTGPVGLARDQVEPVAEGTFRGPQPAQGQLQLGHRDGAAEDVGHVADALEAPDGLGVRRLGRRDVALAPGRQAHEGGRGAVTQVVVRVEHDDRLPGAVDGGGHVPDHQGQARAVDLDPPRELAELVGQRDEQAGRQRPRRFGSRRLHPALGDPQPGLDAADLAGGHQGADVAVRQHRSVREHLVGERLHPAPELGLAPLLGQRRDDALHQAGGPVRVAGGQRVLDRRRRVAGPLVPGAGPAVQVGHLARGARRAAGRAARRRTGGGSGTTGAGRRAATRNRLARSSASSVARPPGWPVTASHSGPDSRSRIEVSSRNRRTSSGWRCTTSSTR